MFAESLVSRSLKKGFHRVSTWDLGGEKHLRIWMLILGIVLVSVFSDFGSAVSRFGSLIATA